DVGAAVRVRHCELREIGAAARLLVNLGRALGARLDLLGGRGYGYGKQEVRDVVLGSAVRRGLQPRKIYLQLACRDVSDRNDVALTQQLHRQLSADVIAKVAIVDALLGEDLRQLVEGDVAAFRDVVERLVDHFVRDLNAESLGALDLDFLDDQALENLSAQHVARRQLGLLLAQASDHLLGLLLELASQHHAFIDDGRDPIQQHAAARQLARLRDPLDSDEAQAQDDRQQAQI